MEFQKVHGAEGRQDGVYRIGRRKWEVIFGYGEDELGGYNLRAQTREKPTREELQKLLTDTVNAAVAEKILRGMTWEGRQVWLSQENQMNYRTAYDRAVRTDGASLPMTVKLGGEYEPEYVELKTLEEAQEFCDAVAAHIDGCIKDGWKEKDVNVREMLDNMEKEETTDEGE